MYYDQHSFLEPLLELSELLVHRCSFSIIMVVSSIVLFGVILPALPLVPIIPGVMHIAAVVSRVLSDSLFDW